MSIVSTTYGKMQIIDSDRVVSRSLNLYGEWAEDELNLLREIISENSCVLDVGAFIGTHTIAFSQFVGSKGIVYSFEPRQEIFQILLENISLNNCSNVTAFNIGLAENEKILNLPLIDIHKSENFGGLSLKEASSDAETYSIKLSTIDNLNIKKIDLIKLDVEGMERQVLDGAVQSISRHRPIIFCECNSLQSGADLLEFCNQQRYSVYAFLASAYNPNNLNKIKENIFGDSKELALLLISKDKSKNYFDRNALGNLLFINTLEDLVLPLLHKPQYAHEVLANTSTNETLGINFPSPVVAQYVEIVSTLKEETTALKKEIAASKNEVARMKATTSWIITKPFRAIWNAFHSIRSTD